MTSRITRRQSLLALTGAFGHAGSQDAPVAFHYQAHFDGPKTTWYSRFGTLVTGAILPGEIAKRLRQRGARLISYEWSSAFYADDPVSAPLAWQREVLARKKAWLLNTEPVTGGAAEGGRGAWWYDFADPALRSRRAAHLAEMLARSGYDGLFFDTLGFEQLPPPVQASFSARHKGQDYNRAQAAFLGELRKLVGGSKVLFLNQGYRQAELFLPHADYDLSESYFTLSQGNTTRIPCLARSGEAVGECADADGQPDRARGETLSPSPVRSFELR